jgi:hypothetical protein
MYNGFTGEKIDARIFIGPCFYQRLKHMVTIGHSNMKNIASLGKFSRRHVQIAGTSCKLLVLSYNRNIIMVLVNH